MLKENEKEQPKVSRGDAEAQRTETDVPEGTPAVRTEGRKVKRVRQTAFMRFEDLDLKVETRAAADGREKKSLKIRFAFLNQPYEIGDITDRPGTGFMLEDFDSSAFDKTIREQNIRVLMNHDPSKVLGATKPPNGGEPTAKIYKDADGRSMICELLDIGTRSYELDLLKTIERKEIDGASQGFYPIRRDWIDPPKEGGLVTHFVREAQLEEVSICTFPQNRQTSVEVRSREEVLRESYELYKRQAESTESPDGHHSEEETRDAASSGEPDPHHEAAAPEAVEVMRARLRYLKLKMNGRE